MFADHSVGGVVCPGFGSLMFVLQFVFKLEFCDYRLMNQPLRGLPAFGRRVRPAKFAALVALVGGLRVAMTFSAKSP